MARFLDAVAMAVIEFVMIAITLTVSLLVAQPDLFGDENWGLFYGVWVLLLIPASIPAYRFEAVSTARSGQTWAKRLAEIQVVRWDGEAPAVGDQGSLERRRCRLRWAIPHLTGLSVAVVAGAVSFATIGQVGVAALAAGITAWLTVYASSLWDKNRRGWHDKAAGTIVVDAPS